MTDHVVAPGPLVDVGQGQEAQRHVSVAHDEAFVVGDDGAVEVRVLEHDPLGLPRGARGVDERGQIAGGGALKPFVEFGIPRRCPAFLQKVAEMNPFRVSPQVRPVVENDDCRQGRRIIRYLNDAIVLDLVPHEHEPDIGVADDVAGLPGCAGGVDGHGDGPGAQDRKIGDGPLGAVAGVDAHHLACPDAKLQEGLRRCPDAFPEGLVGYVVPVIA